MEQANKSLESEFLLRYKFHYGWRYKLGVYGSRYLALDVVETRGLLCLVELPDFVRLELLVEFWLAIRF